VEFCQALIAGKENAEQYGAQGLNMLPSARPIRGRVRERRRGLMDMLTRMETGKFAKEGDDLLAATRYGVMRLRFAEQIYRKPQPRRRADGAWSGWMGQ